MYLLNKLKMGAYQMNLPIGVLKTDFIPNGPTITLSYDGTKYTVKSRFQKFKQTKHLKLAEQTFNNLIYGDGFKRDEYVERVISKISNM